MTILKIGLVGLLAALAAFVPVVAQVPNATRAVAVMPASQQATVQEFRVALVIGNGAYQTSPLKNPANDARSVSAALQMCGFQVQTLVNATLPQMESALRQFGQRLKSGSVGLFYYAGHGMQVKGSNYLIPVGADIAEEDEVRFKALDASEVLAKMESAGNGLNLMILDACRNDPFGRSWRRGGLSGLAQMEAPTGTYVAFSTAPGKTASDGTGANGLYTQKFLEALNQPGLKVEEVFKRVRVGVKLASNDEQVPWDSSSLTGDFYFRPGAVPVQPLPAKAVAPVPVIATLAPSVNLPEPWKVLAKDGFETQTEYEKRIAALPSLPLGRAIPQPESYDIDKHRLPVVLEPGTWAKPYVRSKKITLKLDRDQAKALCDAGDSQRLEGRFEVVDGKVTCVRLVVASPVGQFSPSRQISCDLGDTDEVDLGNGAMLSLVYISAGSFKMGSSGLFAGDEGPVHEVTISQGFWMGKYDVTQAQWQAVMGNNPSNFKGDDRPVECVSWDDCQQFISRLNAMEQGTFRLPTEAEWEYACRAGSTEEPYGHLDATAWYRGNSGTTTHPVGQKQANAWGLFDMKGNVWQWCQDWYRKYSSESVTDPKGPMNGEYRVVRGGSWYDNDTVVRSTFRLHYFTPVNRNNNLGFRVVGVAWTQ